MPRPTLFGDRTTPLLEARIGAFYRNLPKALAGEEEPIHQVRVAGRRLRTVLPVIVPKPDGRRARRAVGLLREIVRVAGRSRDLDVCVQLLDERLPARGTRTPEEALLIGRLKAARSRSRSQLASSLLDLEIAALRRDLREIVTRGGEEIFSVLLRIKQERQEGGVEILAQLDEMSGRYDAAGLHRLRRRVRRMRYMSEVAAELRQEPIDAPRRLKEVQDQLGLIHDAHLLALWLGARSTAAAKAGRPALASAARRWESIFETAGRAHHRAFLQGDPATSIARALALPSELGTAAG